MARATRTGTSGGRTGAMVARGLLYAVAAVLTPILVGAGSVAMKLQTAPPPALPAGTRALPAPPAHDPAKRTAVILASNEGTESTDLLAPYAVLAASGEFNVYTAAPERRVISLFPGAPQIVGVDFMPHYSFAEYDRRIGATPDLVVVPFVAKLSAPEDEPMRAWLRGQAESGATVLSICGGVLVVADAGLLDGRSATTHHWVLPRARERYPQVRWLGDRRYVDDGSIISSAGITAGIDASLYAIQRMIGREAAEATARRLHYPHTRFLDDPTFEPPDTGAQAMLISSAYRWVPSDIGLPIYEGMDEIALAAVTDSYPRTFAAVLRTVAPERTFVRSRYGLDLMPRDDFGSVPRLERVIVPEDRIAPDDAAAAAQLAERHGLTVDRLGAGAPGAFSFDVVLQDVARRHSRALAGWAATGLEYPAQREAFVGAAWPLDLLLRPLVLGAAALLAALWLGRRLGVRRPARVAAGSATA